MMTSVAVFAMLTLLAGVPAEVRRSVIDPYLTIQAGLVHDSIEGLATAGDAIVVAARALGADAAAIEKTASRLATASDLADARVQFADLSEAIEAYRSDQHLRWPDGVRQAYCPMVRKKWLQTEPRIANPYYGRKMPTCGSFR